MEILLGVLVWLTAVGGATPINQGSKHIKDDVHLDEDTIIPFIATDSGQFLSSDQSHVTREKRDTASQYISHDLSHDHPVYIGFIAFGSNFHINLTKTGLFPNHRTLVEYFHENTTERSYVSLESHYAGTVVGMERSRAIFTLENGMHGVVETAGEKYYIEPLEYIRNTTRQPHRIYKRRLENKGHFCGTSDSTPQFRSESYSGTARQKRSVSTQRYVETLVVADKTMAAKYGKRKVENYLLTVMNIVSQLYRDASIGNMIQIVVTRIIVLMHHQTKLYLTHHADKSLKSFCQWQKSINSPQERRKSKAPRHDNAILITRHDICTYQNKPCATLGLAPVAGMCDPLRSCSIIEDLGLASAFTIAHEMGHNFGMHHDGTGNTCGQSEHQPAGLMAAQITSNNDPFSWSVCSKDYITQFLDSGQAKCLDNIPPEWNKKTPKFHIGRVHSADEQCQSQFGEQSRQCPDEPWVMCSVLWCSDPNDHCVTHNLPAAEGTECTSFNVDNGWCFRGRCIEKGHRPRGTNGGWGNWTTWGECSRSCGGGIQVIERLCDNPRPRFGGKYCIGERKKYRLCNTEKCPTNTTSFRELQCSSYNSIEFRGTYYKWVPYTGVIGGHQKNRKNPCVLYCRARGFNFYTERSSKVVDGTKCYPGSKDVCINGHCQPVGCDSVLGSGAIEDKCGQCGGNGSSCQTVAGVYNKEVGMGVYSDIIEIPTGATNLRIEEIQKSRNYLALKSADGKFYVNGGWRIDWSTKTFEISGTVFNYARPGNKPEYLEAKGPLTKNVIASILGQEENKGISYTFNVPHEEGETTTPVIVRFLWELSPWSECSKSCAKGIEKRVSVCVRNDDRSVVSETYCNPDERPEARTKLCNEQSCPPRWVLGKWSDCSVTCGKGQISRDVACMSQVDDLEQTKVAIKHCEKQEKKPKAIEVCQKRECPTKWVTGKWRNCSADCGTGYKVRAVYCISDGARPIDVRYCTGKPKPRSKERCFIRHCRKPQWVTGKWTQCSVSCGDGYQKRAVRCQTYNSGRYCPYRSRPIGYKNCSKKCVSNRIPDADCKDVNRAHYCPMVRSYGFCNRAYFQKLCCRTCTRLAGSRAG
ncbi:A disintegrin and metalloproteinase with thrombospondin motifs 6-like [Lineus longissimus]|uniref:A disintegrin and metalloproteinase with thrombospondin motifs 6-like n=1 Tax=Lineus longissimus TaxID=88925 RepID=UPI002B4F2A77